MPFVNTYWIFFSVVICVSSPDETKVSYNGAQVWRTVLKGAEDILLIKRLMDNQDIAIWSLCPTQADFLVRAEHRVKVSHQLTSGNVNHTVLISDVQRKIDTQPPTPPLWTETTLRVGHRLNWKKYPTLNIIEEYYNFLADDYSSICKVQTIGYTAENRTIKMINVTNGNPKNKVILIVGGQHGREWVSVTSALYILHTIVTKYDKQRNYIKNKNWLIIPVMNPDGYAYSHTSDRLWRKNRRKFMQCSGVDINRNFDTDWGIAGISENNECKGTYAGPFPFSEAETIALRNMMLSLSSKPVAMVDLHSYGELILFPWGAKTQPTEDVALHQEGAGEMSKAIFKTTKKNYTFGATYHVVYPATGTLVDWSYNKGVKHAYVIESRDKSDLGFLLPPEEIEDTGKELYAAVRNLARLITGQAKQMHKDTENQTWF